MAGSPATGLEWGTGTVKNTGQTKHCSDPPTPFELQAALPHRALSGRSRHG
jgi:hypothetical protein